MNEYELAVALNGNLAEAAMLISVHHGGAGGEKRFNVFRIVVGQVHPL
jgi:hypothetical protein